MGVGGSGGSMVQVAIERKSVKKLYGFAAVSPFPPYNNDGAQPNGGFVVSGNTLFGTSQWGGNGRNGTVFSISLPVGAPQLAIIPSEGRVVCTWPTDVTGFTLQSTTNLGSPVWTTNSPSPAVVNGQYTVTNRISGTQQFYR